MDIVALLKVLLRKKWYLIGIPILAVIATYFFTAGIKPVYRSTASLSTGFTTGEQIQITEERINIRDAEVKFNNLIQTMTSETVLMMLSYRLIINDLTNPVPFRKIEHDAEHPDLSPAEKAEALTVFKTKLDSAQLLSSFNPTEAKLAEYLESYGYLNWQLTDNLEVKHTRETDFVTIQYMSENPLLSAFVVNTLADEYIRYDSKMRSSRSNQSTDFFDKLARDKKKVLDDRSALLSQFKLSNGVVDNSIESSTKLNQISDAEVRREQLLGDIQRVNISLASLNKKINEFKGKESGTESQVTINANIVRIREKINQLNDEYTKGGSTNQELANTISDLRYQLQVETSKLSQTGTTTRITSMQDLLDQKEKYDLEKEILEANLNTVNSTINMLKGNVSSQASKEATVESLQKEVDKASEEYLQALDRANLERSKSLIAASSVRVQVKGQPNGYPEFSKRYLVVAFSGVVSFSLCVFVIVFLEYIDVRVKNPKQFKKFVKVPLIGSINLIDSKNLNLFELFSSPSKDHSMEVFKHFLRKLRFEIESSKAKVILVTSTKPGEGKTFIILCMAYLLSMVQKKILIIDTNFKRNSLTQILLRKNENVLKLEQGIFIKGMIGEGKKHEMNDEDIASSIIYQTGHKGISIIGNNGGNESPSEIFAGRDFGLMLDRLRDDFDYIIMEGAALNNFSDSKELIGFTDKVVTVFSAESVIKQLDRESIDYLRNLNGKLIGAVLNKINTKELIL